MFRFLTILLITLLIISGFALLFLVSPLPKVVVQKYIQSTYPESAFLNIKDLKLVPWQTLKVKGVEYQLTQDPDDGVVRIGSIELPVKPVEWYSGEPFTVEIENVSYDSRGMQLKDFDAKLPIHSTFKSNQEQSEGYFRIGEYKVNRLRFQDVNVDFIEQDSFYQGQIEALWSGGRIEGNFQHRLFHDQAFQLTINFKEINLAGLASDVGGVFQRAQGRCTGYITFSGERGRVTKGEGKIVCPRPGGRIQSKFLRGLLDWLPEGATRQIFQQEVEGTDDYYYDEAWLELHNRKPGYWSFNFRIKNPRIDLEVPIDVSAESFSTVWSNQELQKLFKKWSEAS